MKTVSLLIFGYMIYLGAKGLIDVLFLEPRRARVAAEEALKQERIAEYRAGLWNGTGWPK